MKETRHTCIVARAMLMGHLSSYGQRQKFDVFLFGKKIGETIVEMKDSAGYKLYLLLHTSRVKFLFGDKKFYLSGRVAAGRDGLMTLSNLENIKENGSYVTRSMCEKGKLTVEKTGKKKILTAAVPFPSILLYFFVSQHLHQFFYEPKEAFFEIKKEAEGLYSGQVSNHSDRYTCDKGRLIQVEMKNALSSIFLTTAN